MRRTLWGLQAERNALEIQLEHCKMDADTWRLKAEQAEERYKELRQDHRRLEDEIERLVPLWMLWVALAVGAVAGLICGAVTW